MKLLLCVPLALFLTVCLGAESLGSARITYELFYKTGVDAYLQNRWQDCVALIEKAIEDYFYFRTITLQCRSKCQKNETSINSDASEFGNELLHLQLIVIERAMCLVKCQNSYFPNRPRMSKETEDDFENKVPYNYLQLCYFKIDELEKAASCAYTFLIHNPLHEVMKTNLQYYMGLPDIKTDEIKYLEPKDYQDLFLNGAELYTAKKYSDAIEVMEKSLEEYLLAEEECRLLCEGSVPETPSEELFIAVASQLSFTLRCKLDCPEKLSNLYGQKHSDLFSSHYHYLQFSYYKGNKLQETCKAVGSYLLLHPDDTVMNSNKNYYSKLSGVIESWFTPRKEAENYYKRQMYEKRLLSIIEDTFHSDKNSKAISKSPVPPPDKITSQKNAEQKIFGIKRKKLSTPDIEHWLEENRIATDLNADDLNGTKRVAFSGLATDKECQKLMNLTTDGAVYGDGYNGKESPHTEFEMFEGLTVARAATLSQRGILDPTSAELFLNISEKARQAVEVYFNLDTELFFAYTHLVCRTSLPDSPDNREDLSHPIHADNCILVTSDECLKEKPAYVWRDYSSIVYLNDDFEGGEFIFAKDKSTIQATVSPKCGSMVAFSAGRENLHGVKAVKKGRRCALAMWYTLESNHRERERDFARTVISDAIKKRAFLKRDKGLTNFEKSTLYKFVNNEETEEKHSHEHTEL